MYNELNKIPAQPTRLQTALQLLLWALALFAAGSAIYLLVFTRDPDIGGGVQHIWNDVDALNAKINALEASIVNINQTQTSQTYATFRREVNDTQFLIPGSPTFTTIPFQGNGFVGFTNDPIGLFDNSNPAYTMVNFDSYVSITVQIFFGANTSDVSSVFCFAMPMLSSIPGMDAPITGGSSIALNSSSFTGPVIPAAGALIMTAWFQAMAGYQINVQCTVASGDAFVVFLTSHVDMYGRLI